MTHTCDATMREAENAYYYGIRKAEIAIQKVEDDYFVVKRKAKDDCPDCRGVSA